MTREEAIRILDPVTTGEALAEIEYYNGFSGKTAAVQAVSDACVLAVAALREQGDRRWIPVTERLPKKDGQYLCNYHFGKYRGMTFTSVLDYYATDSVPHFQHTLGDTTMKVTHWMPLPEPPKGD